MHCKREMKKTAAAAALAILLLAALTPAALAEEGQPIGNFAWEPTGSSETVVIEEPKTEENRRIALSGDVSYDPDTRMFCREVESGSFGVSVPDGAIVTESVSAALSTSLTGELYKNGVQIENPDFSCISDPGKYILAVTANDAMQTVRVGFTILKSPTGSIKEYKMPTDFFVMSATLNGENASYTSDRVDLTADGEYVIDYRSPAAERDMQLCVTIDHTPPTVTLTGLTDGKANGPVTVSEIEEGTNLFLTWNGSQIPFSETITQTGSYLLTVQDAAGNETLYEFVVITYANTSMKALIATGGVLLLALLGYLFYYRKYIRVS